MTSSTRPSYSNVDTADREAQLSSRTDILSKSFATELWMKVINRAVDDAALYKFMRAIGNALNEEEIEYECSANGFLFDELYRIPMDDYIVDVECLKCKHVWQMPMSVAAGSDSICPNCTNKSSWQYTIYRITDQQTIREISLEDLISLWGVDNIAGFRDGCRKRIDDIVKKKIKTHESKSKREEAKVEKEIKATMPLTLSSLADRVQRIESSIDQILELLKQKQ